MANLKKVVSYIVSHPRNIFKGNFTTHPSLDSVGKTSSFVEVGTGICPPKTIPGSYSSTLTPSRLKFLNSGKSISENCDNPLKVCESTAAMYDIEVQYLCNFEQIDKAVDSLKEMVRMGFKPHMATYTRVIYRLFKMEGREDDAAKLFKEMAFYHGTLPNPVSYSYLLHVIRSLSRREDISKLLWDMEDEGMCLNVWSVNIFVDAYCKEGRMEDAESLVKTMKERMIKPNAETYRWLIDGYCLQGKISKSREVFDNMECKGGVMPDIHVYNSLLNGYCMASKMEEAMHLFYELRIVHEKHKAITYESTGLFRVGRYTPIKELFSAGPLLNECTYKIVLKGLCNNSQVEEAVCLFLSMGDQEMVDSDIALYNILLDGASKSGKLGIAKILYNGLTLKGLKPNVVTYAAMINGLCQEGRAVEANELFLEMKEKGFVPDAVTCNILRICKEKTT